MEREESTAPGAASAARAGVRVGVAGRSVVFRRRRIGPALLRNAPRCSCLAVACGDRGVLDSTWAAGLLFGADGVAVTASRDRTARMPPRPTATASLATTVSASMQDFCRVPSCPANVLNVSRGRRLPVSGCPPRPRSGAPAHPLDPPPPPIDRAAWRIRAHAGASPVASPPYSRIAALRFGTWASTSTSYRCRARTGFPPACWSPSLSGWLPTTPPQGGSHMAATIAPAPKRHQRNLLSTLAATALKADLAPRHYRDCPPARHQPEAVVTGALPQFPPKSASRCKSRAALWR